MPCYDDEMSEEQLFKEFMHVTIFSTDFLTHNWLFLEKSFFCLSERWFLCYLGYIQTIYLETLNIKNLIKN